VDTLCLPLEVKIGSAHDDPRVNWSLHMESHEVASVPRKNRPAVVGGDLENFRIAGAAIRQSRLTGRHSIMVESPKRSDDLAGEIFVGEKANHRLRCPGSSTWRFIG
jgi:hypothetical protein